MRGLSDEGHDRVAGVPVLINQLAYAAAVQTVGKVGLDLRDIKRLGSAQALLLVGQKAKRHVAVLDLRVLYEKLRGIYDGGDRCLVIRA